MQAKAIAKAFLKSWMTRAYIQITKTVNLLFTLLHALFCMICRAKFLRNSYMPETMNLKTSSSLVAILALSLISCVSPIKTDDSPSWYVTPKQNNAENLYGVAEGYSMEEATKYALADAASRLMVSVSSESSLIREENQNSVNEEMRQRVKQSIEKISFTNFQVSHSDKIKEKFFVEVQIEKQPFINEQKERVTFLEKKISDLDAGSSKKNPIQRRNSLIQILDLSKELELKSRILAGAGENINLKEKLAHIANFQNQFDKTSDKLEFYFEINSPKEIAQIIRNALNKEKIKTTPTRNASDPNQIVIKIRSESRTNKIYESFLTKLEVDFENIAGGKSVASNSVEVTGSSSIGEKESYAAATKSLEEKISQDGLLKVIGIIN